MAESLYLASLEPSSGKSVVALGVMELLSRRLERVGYLRPVVPESEKADPRIDLIRERYDLGDLAVAVATDEEVQDRLAEGRRDDVFQRIVAAHKELHGRCDFVLIDGTDYTGVASALEFDFNAEVATHLGSPVLALVNGRDRSRVEIVDGVRVARESLATAGCALAATIVNRVEPDRIEQVREALDLAIGEHEPFFVLPEEPLLAMPTVAEVADAVGARLVRGSDTGMRREVTAYKVAAMKLPNYLDHVVDGALVVTPGDRADVILGTFASRLSSTYPNVAALILTGGLEPDPQVLRLIDGLADVPLPVLAVDGDTYTAARDVTHVRAVIRPDNDRKVATALGVFESNVDVAELADAIEVARSERVTPLMFEFELIERARRARRHIVLPEGTDDRILQAAQLLRRRDVVDLTLLGDVDEVRSRITSLGLDLDDVPVIDPTASELHDGFTDLYLELRSHKGITREYAEETMADVSYFGTMLVHTGRVDGMVSGAAHTTAHTIRPAFEIIRTRPDVSIVSSVFLMLLEDRVLVYGDCAVNPNPSAEELADIAISSAETASRFGIEPRIAMLSYSTGESGAGTDVEEVREATALVHERRPDLVVDGPIQYDAAVDVSVGRAKLPESPVAGQATVFVFPDLNTGNNTYKAVQRSAGAVAIGPILQGLAKPVNDLSRGCLVPDIVNTVAITAIQAEEG